MKRFGLRVGIGDLICQWSILRAMAASEEEILVFPHVAYLAFRGSEYSKFLEGFMPLIYREDCFDCSVRAQDGPAMNWHQYGPRKRVVPIDFVDRLTKKTKIPEGDYICINTKVREIHKDTVRQICKELVPLLDKQGCKVVLLGERDVELNQEYLRYREYFSSAYDYLKGLSNVVDLTVPRLGVTAPNLEKLMKDTYIMSRALYSISIGVGGGLILGAAVGRMTCIVSEPWFKNTVFDSLLPRMFGHRLAHSCTMQDFKQDVKFATKITSATEPEVHKFLDIAGDSLSTFRYFNKRPASIIRSHEVTLLCREGDAPVAYGHLDPEDGKTWLGICIIPSAQGRGYGRAMMLALLRHARAKGIRTIHLSVDADNMRACRLYESLGFERMKQKDNICFYIRS